MAIFPKGKTLTQLHEDLNKPTVYETAAQAAAAQARRQYEMYQQTYQSQTSGNVASAKPTAERVIISTEEFMSMPIQSMEELMTVLTMRLRLTGTVLEEDGKLTVTIDQKSKEVTIEARNPIKAKSWAGVGQQSMYQPGDYAQSVMTASGLSLMQQHANLQASMLAQRVDAQVRDILRNGGEPSIRTWNDPIEGPKTSVVDIRKLHDEKK